MVVILIYLLWTEPRFNRAASLQLRSIVDLSWHDFSENLRFFRREAFALFIFLSTVKYESMNKPSKAYDNSSFLKSPDARPIRVQCELIEPEVRLTEYGVENTIVLFGSARSKDSTDAQNELNALMENLPDNPADRTDEQTEEVLKKERILLLSKYYDQAVELSERLTKWSLEHEDPKMQYLICSGGGPGMMEAANKGASQAGGQSIALGISLPFEQGVNQYATPELSFEFHYFFIRKFYFLYHAKAIVVFPGGFGTMDELFETLTLVQTGKLEKKLPVFLYGREFWEGLINFDQFVKWGVISPKDLDLFKIVDNEDEAFSAITACLTPAG